MAPPIMVLTGPPASLIGPPSNPPVDVAELERRLEQMDCLLGR
jgi:hypothetical protein